MNSNSVSEAAPAAAAAAAPATAQAAATATLAAAAASAATESTQPNLSPAFRAAVIQRMQHADDFWMQLEAAAAADLGPDSAKQLSAAFKDAHKQKLLQYNLEQANDLCAQIFSALQQQQD